MPMPGWVSALTVTDTCLAFLYFASHFSCFCWRRWIVPIKGICQNLWAETTSCSPGGHGNKTELVLSCHIKCSHSLSFSSRGFDSDCHTLCISFFLSSTTGAWSHWGTWLVANTFFTLRARKHISSAVSCLDVRIATLDILANSTVWWHWNVGVRHLRSAGLDNRISRRLNDEL